VTRAGLIGCVVFGCCASLPCTPVLLCPVSTRRVIAILQMYIKLHVWLVCNQSLHVDGDVTLCVKTYIDSWDPLVLLISAWRMSIFR